MKEKAALVIGQLGFGGGERQVSLTAQGLARAGWPVVVISLSEITDPFGQEIQNAGIKLHCLKRNRSFQPARVLNLARLLREENVSLVHSHLDIASIYSYLALGTAGKPKFIPTALSMPARNNFVREWFLRRALAAGDAIHVNSFAGLKAYSEHYGVSESKFRIVYNGVLPLPEITEQLRKNSRKSLNIPQHNSVVGILSRDTLDKNIPAFLKLASNLDSSNENLTMLAAGNGLDHNYAAKASQDKLIKCSFVFLGPQGDIGPVLGAMDVFVLTSVKEGLPNAVMEAMACGLPVVAFDAGGVSELIEQNVSGVVVPCGDDQALFREVYQLLKEPERRREMGKAAREKIFKEFSVEKMIENTISLYEEVLKNN